MNKKFSIHGVNLADHGYYINLDTSLDRRIRSMNQISYWKMKSIERFSAIRNENNINGSCTESHLAVFKLAMARDEKVIAVFEDDFVIEEKLYNPIKPAETNTIDILCRVEKESKEVEWDVILLGCNPATNMTPVSHHLAYVDKSTGAWAYLIKQKAYAYIIEHLNYNRDLLAIDDFLPRMNDWGFKTLATIPEVVSHGGGYSTLNPKIGYVKSYQGWFRGNYDLYYNNRFKNVDINTVIESKVAICIPGHFVDDSFMYLETLLKSLPECLQQCKIWIRYDQGDTIDEPTINHQKLMLQRFVSNRMTKFNISVSVGRGGLISSLEFLLDKVRTPYMLFLEHDWVFLDRDIDFEGLIKEFIQKEYINAVWFSKNDNTARGYHLARDVDNNITAFEEERRTDHVNLVPTSMWSNNPALFRVSKLKEWYELYVKDQNIEGLNQLHHGIEESIIPAYKELISKSKWEDIKDEWGTYVYGKMGEGPYVGHTDATNRYAHKGESPEILGRSMLNKIINGDSWMQNIFDKCLSYYGDKGEDLKVLVIGAMDGVSFDAGRPFIDRYGWKGLYVEPVPEMFERLRESFVGTAQEYHNRYENSAIDVSDGTVTMVRIKPEVVDSGIIPHGYNGMSAIHPPKNGLGWEGSGHAYQVELHGEYIEVPAMTLEALFEKHNITELDYVSIDTEGWDWKILQQLDLKKYRPKLIRCEYENLTDGEKTEVKSWLNRNRYFYEVSPTDIDAIPIEVIAEIRKELF